MKREKQHTHILCRCNSWGRILLLHVLAYYNHHISSGIMVVSNHKQIQNVFIFYNIESSSSHL